MVVLVPAQASTEFFYSLTPFTLSNFTKAFNINVTNINGTNVVPAGAFGCTHTIPKYAILLCSVRPQNWTFSFTLYTSAKEPLMRRAREEWWALVLFNIQPGHVDVVFFCTGSSSTCGAANLQHTLLRDSITICMLMWHADVAGAAYDVITRTSPNPTKIGNFSLTLTPVGKNSVNLKLPSSFDAAALLTTGSYTAVYYYYPTSDFTTPVPLSIQFNVAVRSSSLYF